MTHKIKVQMFGNFRMDYNGAPFVAEKMHKESQFNRMMQNLRITQSGDPSGARSGRMGELAETLRAQGADAILAKLACHA